MDATLKGILWGQFGAAIDMLENAIRACPDDLWSNRTRPPEYWYLAYHTLFFLDLYLADATDGFAPPAPFTLTELDPASRACFTEKDELLSYVDHCRTKARARVTSLTAESSSDVCRYGWIELTKVESLFYNMRHVQHHAAQLNLLLRQSANAAPAWVARTARSLDQ